MAGKKPLWKINPVKLRGGVKQVLCSLKVLLYFGGAWVAQLVDRPTPVSWSRGHEIQPHAKSTWDFFCLSLCPSL